MVRRCLLLLAAIIMVLDVLAQPSTRVSGVVKDKEGVPVVGATVFWLGTNEGTFTDNEGKYNIKKSGESRRLVATSIGYAADTIDVGERARVDIILHQATQILEGVTIQAKQRGVSRMEGVMNGIVIGKEEMFRAACCNLGESFTTNGSVDVNYTDAATGASQIRLLGLSGTYVQMLTENMPAFRGLATPFALDYVPGTWMKSIQVSKGAASVKNGYESITGQIDIEYQKPDDDQGAIINIYGNSKMRMEANAEANIHINDRMSTEVLAHYQKDFAQHDDNEDGFMDMPNIQQYNIQNRWKYKGERYIFHGGLSLLAEERTGGQTDHNASSGRELYRIGVDNNRYEGYMKHAYIIDPKHGTNIALMGTMSLHRTEAMYGKKGYDGDNRNAYGQLMFETNISQRHNVAAGVSANYDYIWQRVTNTPFEAADERESVVGGYAQYTYTLDSKMTAMAGVRADRSSMYGAFFTPRLHLKITPNDIFTIRISAGKGYRTAHALAENYNLLASGRRLLVEELEQEEAWNYGINGTMYIPLWGKTLQMSAEYYRTDFVSQAVVDWDSDPTIIKIGNLEGRSFSNTYQVDARYPVLSGLEVAAAFRVNDVRCTYAGVLKEKPLTSRYKGLLTVSYKTALELWQVDATLQVNGGGRLPEGNFPAYEQVSAQVTRWFRYFSVYVGCENMTNYKQKNPILNADTPWGEEFEPTMVWGPVDGIMVYMGARINIGKL